MPRTKSKPKLAPDAGLAEILALVEEASLDERQCWYIRKLSDLYDMPRGTHKTKLDILKELREIIGLSGSQTIELEEAGYDPAVEGPFKLAKPEVKVKEA